MSRNQIYEDLKKALSERILILDGAFGTMLQKYNLNEQDYRGEQFKSHIVEIKGCHDVLSITRPDIVTTIHKAYLEAGSDIISTNSFSANSISLKSYNLEDKSYEIAFSAASLARQTVDSFNYKNDNKRRYVAGSVGPTDKSLSISVDPADPSKRDITFTLLKEAYKKQIKGLLDGGADIILIETVFDTLNAKAALMVVQELSEEMNCIIPVMVSATISSEGGRVLSGQTIEAFFYSLPNYPFLSVGLNCSFGPDKILPHLKQLSRISHYPVSVHPNAGLPDGFGNYSSSKEDFIKTIHKFFEENLVNIVGGCCGTTPDYIKAISEKSKLYKTRTPAIKRSYFTATNLDTVLLKNEREPLLIIGERANVAGSAKFARLIKENNFEEALNIVIKQIDAGARIIDICMDDGLIEGPKAMTRFINLIASDPVASSVPLMIDSSDWEIIDAALQCTQGKSIVNSISLKNGEEDFLKKARIIKRYGASAVVMLFDEKGQADSFEKKCCVAERAYKLLIKDGFNTEDIIFDPNILTIATGINSHNDYARAYIEATRWIKKNLPGARVSGGVSNLSFAFRGNNKLREAMHSVFLYHAGNAGLDMALVNPGALPSYADIEPVLRKLLEDLILNTNDDASNSLVNYLKENEINTQSGNNSEKNNIHDTDQPIFDRIKNTLISGNEALMNDLILLALKKFEAIRIIDELLMPAMQEIGKLFGEGKMFLPQVVKSARILNNAISLLSPYLGNEEIKKKKGKVIIATVKGDIHDIGKNIVKLILNCNGYEVLDLGVSVPPHEIINNIHSFKPDAILLSGLISPSLNEMVEVCKELEKNNIRIPVIVGGAATSDQHTDVKIKPAYSGKVFRAPEATANIHILENLLCDKVNDTKDPETDIYLDKPNTCGDDYVTLQEARRNKNYNGEPTIAPLTLDTIIFDSYPIEDVENFIDYDYLFNAWGLKGKYPKIFSDKTYGSEAKKIFEDSQNAISLIKEENILKLQSIFKIFKAYSRNDDIILTDKNGVQKKLPMLRSRNKGNGFLSAADFVSQDGDYICLFALTAGIGLLSFCEKLRKKNDEYAAIMMKLISDRLTEAFAEKLHSEIREKFWGFEKNTTTIKHSVLKGNYEGCRMAIGYPAIPDHTLKKDIFDLLEVEKFTDMRLNENYMIIPEESICGIIFSKGRYFSLGNLDKQQISDYLSRREFPKDEVLKSFSKFIIE